MLALADLTPWHAAAHVVIFFGYVAAMVLVPRAFDRLMRLHLATKLSAAGFFVCCGITHLGLAFGDPYTLLIEINDHLQAGFIITFVFMLTRDLGRVVRRMASAYIAIGVRYGGDTMDTVRDTIYVALHGE